MSKSQRTPRRRGSAAPAVPKPTPIRVPPSLPLAVTDTTGVPSLQTGNVPTCHNCKTLILNPARRECGSCQIYLPLNIRYPEKASLHPKLALEDDSQMREKAVKAYFLRQNGFSDEEIGPIVGLKPRTISSYVYKAGKNGWLDDMLHDPKDQMKYQVFHKVVRRIDEALDSQAILKDGMKESTAVALKVGHGTLFDQPGEMQQGPQVSTIVGIKVEVVGEPQAMRAGTISGNSSYVDVTPEKP